MTIVLDGTNGITNDGGYTGDGVVFADTTPANTLVTTTGGNVGIGTSSPAYKLHVAGTASTDANADLTGAQFVTNGIAFRQRGNSAGISGATYAKQIYASGSPDVMEIYNASNYALVFGTNSTERARIDSSGNLLVGTTSAGAKLSVAGQTGGAIALFSTDGFSSSGLVAIKGHNGAGYNAELYLECPGLIGGWVYMQRASSQLRVSCGSQTNGVSLSNGGSSWGTFSDERLKDIIEPITDAAAKVSTLRPVIGKYKTDADGVRRSFLIAQDVQAVLPEAVYQNSETDDTLNLSYTDTIPLLVAAIQEQQAIITALTARVAALEGTQP